MTSLSARRYGIARRGEVHVGYHADLVLFDPASVIDAATFESRSSPRTGSTPCG